jgi:hypothetical protein
MINKIKIKYKINKVKVSIGIVIWIMDLINLTKKINN